MLALKRNSKINVTYFSEEESFNTSKLKNKFDIILIPENHSDATPESNRDSKLENTGNF